MQRSCSAPGTGLFPTPMGVSASTFDGRLLPSDRAPQYERCTHEPHTRETSPISNTAQDNLVSTIGSAQPYPSCLLPPPENSQPSHPLPAFNGSHNHQTDPQPPIPLCKPPEMDTLMDSHIRFVPLLLWIAHDSDLVPCNPPPEYLYLCMGLFFISNLRVSHRYLILAATDRIVACSDPA